MQEDLKILARKMTLASKASRFPPFSASSSLDLGLPRLLAEERWIFQERLRGHHRAGARGLQTALHVLKPRLFKAQKAPKSGVRMPPLATKGIDTRCRTAAMASQSQAPVNWPFIS